MIKRTNLATFAVALLLAYVAVSECNNYHHSGQHRQPCCSHNHCIRVRNNGYNGEYDWISGCCIPLDSRDAYCYARNDGYYTVQAFCDYEYDCFNGRNVAAADVGDKVASLIKVNQTDLHESKR